MAAKPTVEPTDKSMPPVKMTKVMPTAMIALIAVCPTRMIRFCWVKNAGESTEKIPSKTNKAIKALNRKRSTPKDKPDGLDEDWASGGSEGRRHYGNRFCGLFRLVCGQMFGLLPRAGGQDQSFFAQLIVKKLAGDSPF